MNSNSRIAGGLLVWSILLSLAGGLALTAGAAFYAQRGGAVLARVNDAVPRLFVVEAARMSRAGESDKVLALYDRALQAGFGHPPDKSRTLALKGLILWDQGRVREAAETLSASASGTAPDFRGARALVEALLHLKRLDEAQSAVRRWREAQGETAEPQVMADILYCKGRVAQERGDLKAARGAYEESAALVPRGLADYALAFMCFDGGDFGDAKRHLEEFLLGGATGAEAESARELCRRLESPPPPLE